MKTSTLLPTLSTLVIALASAALLVASPPAAVQARQPTAAHLVTTSTSSKGPDMQRPIDSDQSVNYRLWLATDGLTRVDGHARLRVTHGLLWLTVDNQLDDHMLVAGDRYTLRRGEHALVQAMKAPAGVEVVEPAPATWRQWATALIRAAEQRLAGVLS